MLSTFNRLSFKQKLILITIPMFLGNLLWGNLVVWEHGNIMLNANHLHRNLAIIKSASHLIHDVQKKNQSDFTAHLSELKESAKNISPTILEQITNIEKKQTSDSLESTIDSIIQFQMSVANLDHLDGIESYLNSLPSIEMAEEKIRMMAEDFKSSNEPNLTKKNAQLMAIISSPTLLLSANGKTALTALKDSEDWKILQTNIEKISNKNPQIESHIIKVADIFSKIIDDEFISIENQIENQVSVARIWFYGASGFLTFATIIVAFLLTYVIKNIVNDLRSVSDSLLESANQLNESSLGLSTTSSSLSMSTNDQASALQETAAAIHEVTATIEQNSTSTQLSSKASSESTQLAHESQEAIQEMVGSIHQITEGNQLIMQAIEHGNNEIAEIVKVIEEIGGKTKVINDIVFQTKLLAFNASVEAARAGEHGKGFAVVAEEVGNLAHMSGTSATEISKMLDESTHHVHKIVANTKERVQKLIDHAKETLQQGVQTADRCQSSLNDVLNSVQTVDTMIASIAMASSEQARGVGEINKAITQLDQITHQNASGAQNCATAANDLSHQSQKMKLAADELNSFIIGKNDPT